jgi:hypothetical protein
MSKSKIPGRKANERQEAAKQTSTRQVAREAVRGGAKSEKRNRRPGAGGAQKG